MLINILLDFFYFVYDAYVLLLVHFLIPPNTGE
jgi:hypothetical protein